MNKDSWPKTADGTIDWEVVFEDEENGFIPLISRAHTVPTLRQGAIAIVTMLHTRKDDPPLIDRFASEIESLIPEDATPEQLPDLVQGVVRILRTIKEERARKADEFAQLQHDDVAVEDKREIGKRVRAREAQKKRADNLARQQAKQKRNVKIGIGVGLALVLIVAGWVFLVPKKQDRLRTFLDQMEAVAAGTLMEKHVFGGRLQAQLSDEQRSVTAYGVPADTCANAGWYFANRGTVVINDVLPQRIAPNVLKELCSIDPRGATIMWVSKTVK